MPKPSPKEPVQLALDTPVQYLKGVGPRRNAFFKRLGIQTLQELLAHYPRRYEDRSHFVPIAQLTPGEKVTVRARIMGASVFRARTGTVIFQLSVRDASGPLTALWFNQPYMKKWFTVGQDIVLYGTAEQSGRRWQMVVPEFELVPPQAAQNHKSLHMGRVVPMYPATSGLHQRELRNAVAWALKGLLPTMKDMLPASLRERLKLMPWPHAMKNIHFPTKLELVDQARDRLSFDELFRFQLGLVIRKKRIHMREGVAHVSQHTLLDAWRDQLPFTLTEGQEAALESIARDMQQPHPMHRLLQGEVGSGKTVVASFAAVLAVASGTQAAFLAPTEVLARQHAISLSKFLEPIGISVRLLTSSLDEASRKSLKADLDAGEVQVLIGTHALLEDWVQFQQLGLVVIDEQQKFGVHQRDALVQKGNHPDLLILTATPIPRTLALTLYGEMDVTTIRHKPAGRQPIATQWLNSTRREEGTQVIQEALDKGQQVYVVCPRIGGDESNKKTKKTTKKVAPTPYDLFDPILPELSEEEVGKAKRLSALEMHKLYQDTFPQANIGLMHGRMKADEQKAVFESFKANEVQILVATQMIEVGVDVPNATVIVIESAEWFGLSQLHQLRGRVGRGEHAGTCILMADPKTQNGVDRMQILERVSDAFQIAEEDLRLRGPGQLLGNRQAGLPDLRCLEWDVSTRWMTVAREEAEKLLVQDPQLQSEIGQMLMADVETAFPQLVEVLA